MKYIQLKKFSMLPLCLGILLASTVTGCKHSGEKQKNVFDNNAASKVYVPPGKYDELYMFSSGGSGGQVSVYGLPSGRLFKEISVFSQNTEDGYGYSEE